MAKIYLGFMLTLLASLLVVLAGVILSRRSITETTRVDRALLNDLLAKVERAVLAWKKSRFEELDDFAFELAQDQTRDVEDRLKVFPGVRGAFLYRNKKLAEKWVLLGAINERSPAEVIQDEKDFPLNPDRAVVIPKDLLEEVTFGQSGRLRNKEGSFDGWWFSPLQGEVVVFLIETFKEDRALASHLQTEFAGIWSEVEGAGEQMMVTLRQQPLMGEAMGDQPPSIEKGNSAFAVMAWNQTSTRKEFHWPTMNSAIALAILILGLGFFALGSQRRMWRRSQEQVSFANRVSHELGTPLTNITLNLELASRSLPDQPALASQRIDKVQEEVSRLGRLVKNVLTYSK